MAATTQTSAPMRTRRSKNFCVLERVFVNTKGIRPTTRDTLERRCMAWSAISADGVADDAAPASVGEEALRGGEVRLDVVQLSREGKPTADAEIVGGMSKVAEDFDVGVAVELAVEFAREGLVEGGDAGITMMRMFLGAWLRAGRGKGEVSGGEDARAPRVSPQRGAPQPTTTRAQMCVGRTRTRWTRPRSAG